ncbi:MAG: hypothetical protein V1495_00015 [Pseudomonadota bacterium]
MKKLLPVLVCSIAQICLHSDALGQTHVFPEGYLTVQQVGQLLPSVENELLEVSKSVVRVRLRTSGEQQLGAGTGTLVHTEEGVVLKSAYHIFKPLFDKEGNCIDGRGRIIVESADSSKTEELHCNSIVNLSDEVRDADLIMLNVSPTWTGTSLVMPSRVDVGDEVVLLGYPEIYQDGMVASLGHVMLPMDGTGKRIVLTASASPGMSGGLVLQISRDGKLNLLGHVVHQLIAEALASVPVKYRWGDRELTRPVCLNQDELNGILSNGSHTAVSFKGRLIKTTQYILDRKKCDVVRWTWDSNFETEIKRQKKLVRTFRNDPDTDGNRLQTAFTQKYFDLLNAAPVKGIKMADVPIGSYQRTDADELSGDNFRTALAKSADELKQFQSKLDRVRKLFPKSGNLEDWLKAIDLLDLPHHLDRLNNHFLYGMGVLQIW